MPPRPRRGALRVWFENRLVDLIAAELDTTVEYTWWASRRGFVRNTLNAGACDVVMGVPDGWDLVRTTRPYYRSTYVFLTVQAAPRVPRSLADDALRRLRVGVQIVGDDGASSPPAHILAERGIVTNVVGYSVLGDYSTDSPPSRIVTACIYASLAITFISAGHYLLQVVRLTSGGPVTPR